MKFIQGKTYYFVYKAWIFTSKLETSGLAAIAHKLFICSDKANQPECEVLWKISKRVLLEEVQLPNDLKVFTSRRKAESYRKQLEKTIITNF